MERGFDIPKPLKTGAVIALSSLALGGTVQTANGYQYNAQATPETLQAVAPDAETLLLGKTATMNTTHLSFDAKYDMDHVKTVAVAVGKDMATPYPRVPKGSIWDKLAYCESRGRWHIATGNGYYGGIQFDKDSWEGAGGEGYPHTASRNEQIYRGKIWKKLNGASSWPHCAPRVGLR